MPLDGESPGGLNQDNKLRPICSSDNLLVSPFSLFGGFTIHEITHSIRKRGSSRTLLAKRDFLTFEMMAKVSKISLANHSYLRGLV